MEMISFRNMIKVLKSNSLLNKILGQALVLGNLLLSHHLLG